MSYEEQMKVFNFTEGWMNRYYHEDNLPISKINLEPYEPLYVKTFGVHLHSRDEWMLQGEFGEVISLMVRFLDSLGMPYPELFHNESTRYLAVYQGDRGSIKQGMVYDYGNNHCRIITSNQEEIHLPVYFQDWTRPTRDELNYFKMVTDIDLIWSEGQPLPIVENRKDIDKAF
jgi:hypothetical protein